MLASAIQRDHYSDSQVQVQERWSRIDLTAGLPDYLTSYNRVAVMKKL
jgi:hypothetical protein